MADFHFFTDTMSVVSSSLSTYVNDIATAIASGFSGVASTMLAVYVCLWGWSMMRGVISEPVTDGVSRIVRLAIIVGLATNIGLYNGYISDFLWNAPEALANLIASGYSDSTTNANFLDVLFGKVYTFGESYYEKGYASTGLLPDYGMVAAAYAIWAFGIAATAYAAFLLVLAKIVLAVALGIGPLFVLSLMFEPSKRLFDAWLGQGNRSLSGVLCPPAPTRNNPSHIHQGGAGSDQGDSDQQQVAAAWPSGMASGHRAVCREWPGDRAVLHPRGAQRVELPALA